MKIYVFSDKIPENGENRGSTRFRGTGKHLNPGIPAWGPEMRMPNRVTGVHARQACDRAMQVAKQISSRRDTICARSPACGTLCISQLQPSAGYSF